MRSLFSKIALSVVTAATLAYAADAKAQPVDTSQAVQLSDFYPLSSGQAGRMNCDPYEIVIALNTAGYPVTRLDEVSEVDFGCAKRVGERLVVTKLKRAKNADRRGFQAASQMKLWLSMDFVFRAL